LLRATTPPGRYTLRVPPNLAVPTARALAKLPSQKLLDFQGYIIRRGDTLSKVAGRFKVSEDDLLATNYMNRAQFKLGRRIQVPPPSAIPIDDKDLLSKDERAKILGDQPLPSLPSLPGDPKAKTSATSIKAGVVEATPSAKVPVVAQPIAAPLVVPAPVIASVVSPQIPQPSQPLLQVPAPAVEPVPLNAVVPRFYPVQAGDTLASIARAFSVSLSELERLNSAGTAALNLGDSVRLPDAPGILNTASPLAAPAPDQSNQAPKVHIVQRKETLFSIATRYGVSSAQLRQWNHLRSNKIRLRQRLRVVAPN
jgi:LysM repeat protein